MEQQLQELGYAAVKKLLDDRKEIAVSSEAYETLKEAYNELRANHKAALQATVSEERARAEHEAKITRHSQELEHLAHVAKMNAQNEQLREQVKFLEETIASLKSDLADQRQLTRHVAEAGRPSALPAFRPSDRV